MSLGVVNELLEGLIGSVLAHDKQIGVILNAGQRHELVRGDVSVAQHVVEHQVAVQHTDGVAVGLGIDKLAGAYQTGAAGNVGNNEILGDNALVNSVQHAADAQVSGAAGAVGHHYGNVLGGIVDRGSGGGIVAVGGGIGGRGLSLAAAGGQGGQSHRGDQQSGKELLYVLHHLYSSLFFHIYEHPNRCYAAYQSALISRAGRSAMKRRTVS